MKRIFVPTETGTDWQRLLGKPKLHWKQGRSAMSAAACWEESQPQLPSEITQVLEGSGESLLSNLELVIAIPEWEVELPGGSHFIVYFVALPIGNRGLGKIVWEWD